MNDQFFFREAEIFDVNTKTFTCSLRYGDLNSGEISHNVPMPNIIGAGNSGLIINLMKGTRVIVAYMHDKSREAIVIVAVLPSYLQKLDNYNDLSSNLIDKSLGTLSYPKTMNAGEAYLSSHLGPSLFLRNNDSFLLSSRDSNGLFLTSNNSNNTKNLFSLSHNHILEGSGGKMFFGRVKRINKNITWDTFKEFYTDIERYASIPDIGFWRANKVSKINNNFGPRNLALSEYRLIINEFATEFGFSGFDKEIFKNKNIADSVARNPNSSRDRDPGNILKSSEGDLIEIVGGNLVDINGFGLDINYNPIQYSLVYPNINVDSKFLESIKKSRRGVGYHFKLSTNVNSTDVSQSLNDFIFDIDKEGLLKINIPKSTATGNIPYVNNVVFSGESNERIPSYSLENKSTIERIPVNTRDRDGTPVNKKIKNIFRSTGVRFANSSESKYFRTKDGEQSNTIRVNTTKHHNIYATAERLIANKITKIHVPTIFSKEEALNINGTNIGTFPSAGTSDSDFSKHSAFEIFENNDNDVKSLLYSAVGISPDLPAISTGGDTHVAGKTYSNDDKEQPLISNYFKTSNDENGINISPELGDFENVQSHGGVSSSINMEGSLELSVGSDNVDKKSIVLDTAGSLIAWFGKDKNNRSIVTQTDGDVLINIGGSYPKTSNIDDIPAMNTGRFDLRVNVVDKGFYDSDGNRKRAGSSIKDEAGYSSDYIISISENGLVIAGMKADAPMIIRNDGPLMLESASSKLILKGMTVETVEYGKLPTDDGRSKK